MKTLLLILFLTMLSCKRDPPKTYTLMVVFTDGTVDTLKVDHGYRINNNGDLEKLEFADYDKIARNVKYVKEIL